MAVGGVGVETGWYIVEMESIIWSIDDVTQNVTVNPSRMSQSKKLQNKIVVQINDS